MSLPYLLGGVYNGSSRLFHPACWDCMTLPGSWSSFAVCHRPRKVTFLDSQAAGHGHFPTIIISPPSPSSKPLAWMEGCKA